MGQETTRDEDLDSPAGQMASAAAAVVRRMADKPGIWDFLEEFNPRMHLIELEARAKENELAQTPAAASEGRRLYLYQRGVELADAILAAKAAIHDREHGHGGPKP